MSAVSAATRVRELFERQPATLRLVPDRPERVAPVQRTDRPQTLADFVGQEPLIGAMSVWLEAAIMDGRAPGHALLSGYPGLGKTSLAAIIAHELGVTMHATTADGIGNIQGLAKWLSKIQEGDVGFIDEAHDMTARVQLSLGLAMEDGRMVLPAKSGAQSEEVVVEVPPFTLVCAMTDAAEVVREIAEEKRESAQNIEDGFGHSTSASEELSSLADELEEWATSIENADIPEYPDANDADCEECEGSGSIGEDNCEECGGSGHPSEPTEEQLEEWRMDVEDVTSVLNDSPC